MVQDVEDIEPELRLLLSLILKALLRLVSKRQTGSVAQGRYWPQFALFSRKRILQNILARISVAIDVGDGAGGTGRNDPGDCLQIATRCGSGVRHPFKFCAAVDIKALRIFDLDPLGPIEEITLDRTGSRDLTPHFVSALASSSLSKAGSATSGTPFAYRLLWALMLLQAPELRGVDVTDFPLLDRSSYETP